MGCFWSAIVVASYNSGYDTRIAAMYGNGHFFFDPTISFLKQGGLQVAGAFCSVGMSIIFGLAAGLIISHWYNEKNKYFYLDT